MSRVDLNYNQRGGTRPGCPLSLLISQGWSPLRLGAVCGGKGETTGVGINSFPALGIFLIGFYIFFIVFMMEEPKVEEWSFVRCDVF